MSKTVMTGGGTGEQTTTTTVFVSDRNQEVAEYTANADPQTTPPLRKYVYAEYIDEPVLMLVSSGETETKYYYHQNHLYSVAALSDQSGAVQERYAYTAYGKPLFFDGAGNLLTPQPSGSPLGNPYLYTGRRLDGETGLYYYRARYYSAELGRFVGRDPIGFGAGDGDLYRYTADSPLKWVDPFGLQEGWMTRALDRLMSWGQISKNWDLKEYYPVEGKEAVYWQDATLEYTSKTDPTKTLARTVREVKECRVVIELAHFITTERAEVIHPLFSPIRNVSRENAPYSATCPGRFGLVSCWASWFNEGNPNLIASFPVIHGIAGIGDPRDMPNFHRRFAEFMHGLHPPHFSLESGQANAGWGRGRSGFQTLLERAWNAGVEEGRRMARRTTKQYVGRDEPAEVPCCKVVEVVFHCPGGVGREGMQALEVVLLPKILAASTA